MFQNLSDLFQLAQDENFKKFLSHPGVQTLMKDSEFQRAVREKNFIKLMANPEFADLLKDSEVRSALAGMQEKFKKNI
ncbi:MAG: hypothetical protein A3C35_06970 [Omnitrophica bacterium RIFCSPHIGHO2_02_FULL_46_11]|nr:MAG: hypothetical protein A3A81_06880 [Omnitrophica bacterium RIFCSPLOWO2_01_FULL_45_10b]OGW87226.1 MAG: hypothetical protein A3C35_06970 [Omnitrophica bacterium RIFCSPHIGHO2_02_FULL_46_11]